MKNSDVEKKLRNEIDKIVPDVLDKVLLECEKIKQFKDSESAESGKLNDTNVVNFKHKLLSFKRCSPWMKLASTVAAILLFFGSAFAVLKFQSDYAIDTKIFLDVNPSIQLGINKDNVIVDVNGINDEAVQILNISDVKGVDIKDGIRKLIDALVDAGYLTQNNNSILVTVNNSNESVSTFLEEKIVADINMHLSSASASVKPSIIGQTLSNEYDTDELINGKNLSPGKVSLIKQMIAADPTKKFDDYENLSISDLNLIANGKKVKLKNGLSVGSPNKGKYIGESKALSVALSLCGINRKSAKNIDIEFDREDGKMVYEIEFYAGSYEYEYVIDAIDGSAVESGKKLINKRKSNKIYKSNLINDDDDDDDDDDDHDSHHKKTVKKRSEKITKKSQKSDDINDNDNNDITDDDTYTDDISSVDHKKIVKKNGEKSKEKVAKKSQKFDNDDDTDISDDTNEDD